MRQGPRNRRVRSLVVRKPPSAWRTQAAEAARRSRRRLAIYVPALAGLLVLYVYRRSIFGVDVPVRIAVAIALVILGWAIARGLGRLVQPYVMNRLDPAAAGAANFVVRLVTLAVAILVSFRLAGLSPGALIAGASFTAVVLGLAAQQTIGNVFAGVMLLSARPFRIGDRVRFAGFGMDVEGTVSSHGLLYVTMHDGQDLVLVPNNTALTMSVRPIREPAAVDMRARLPLGTDPEAVQERVQSEVSVTTLAPPDVALEAMEGEEIVFRIKAVPSERHDGGRLAREVLRAVTAFRGRATQASRAPVPAP